MTSQDTIIDDLLRRKGDIMKLFPPIASRRTSLYPLCDQRTTSNRSHFASSHVIMSTDFAIDCVSALHNSPATLTLLGNIICTCYRHNKETLNIKIFDEPEVKV